MVYENLDSSSFEDTLFSRERSIEGIPLGESSAGRLFGLFYPRTEGDVGTSVSTGSLFLVIRNESCAINRSDGQVSAKHYLGTLLQQDVDFVVSTEPSLLFMSSSN